MAVTLNASTSSGLVQTADTSGTIELQSNGTTKLSVLSTGVSGTLVQGTAVASTSGTSIDFTGIPSWVKRVTVMFSGVSTNGTSIPQIQLGDAGGVETTSYLAMVSNVQTASNTTRGVTATTGFILVHAGAATNVLNGAISFFLLGSNTWVVSGNLYESGSAGLNSVSGSKTLSDTLDQVRITTVNGTDTFDVGTINLQYEG
jgi:hypothetical protein